MEEGYHLGAYDVVQIYAGLGEKDHAFEWLERAYEENELGMALPRG